MKTFKEMLSLNEAFLVTGQRPEEFELIREACIATLLADEAKIVRDLSAHLRSKKILPPDYHITEGFAGDNQVFAILESPSLSRRIIAYLGDLDEKYRHLRQYSFKTMQ